MKLKLNYPKDLYSDVRVEEFFSILYNVENGQITADYDLSTVGAMIRVFDGELWYTSVTNEIGKIQEELDSLALMARPDPDICKVPEIEALEVNVDSLFRFDGDNDFRNVTRDDIKMLTEEYISKCIDHSLGEVNFWYTGAAVSHTVYSFCSSKGAELEHDMQNGRVTVCYGINVDGVTTYAYKDINGYSLSDLFGHEQEVIETRDRYLDYAHNAVSLEPGEYRCVLSPRSTAIFTHESFGHKSEADFMLNDKVLRDEWVMGKKVGSELVSICDDGGLRLRGYVPYDAEGTKARPTWLIKNGELCGRLHDAHSAVTLGEELTGNSRAQDYQNIPIVRMTNTYMLGGDTDPEAMIGSVEDGVYVWQIDSGTGQATFTMRPSICYRIRHGKLCEPLRVNVINGNVFRTLFDIEAVGNDFEYIESGSCGKNGQSVVVSMGGPSVLVKKLSFN